jgi:predicted aspartyl protease
LPEDVVKQLGLVSLGEVEGEAAEGKTKLKLSGLAIIRIEDRIAECLVIVRPKGTTPVIGVAALEQMGFRVDPITGKLIKVYR